MGSIAGLDDIQATTQYQPPETLASAGNQPVSTPTTATTATNQPAAVQPQPTTNQPPAPVEPEQRKYSYNTVAILVDLIFYYL